VLRARQAFKVGHDGVEIMADQRSRRGGIHASGRLKRLQLREPVELIDAIARQAIKKFVIPIPPWHGEQLGKAFIDRAKKWLMVTGLRHMAEDPRMPQPAIEARRCENAVIDGLGKPCHRLFVGLIAKLIGERTGNVGPKKQQVSEAEVTRLSQRGRACDVVRDRTHGDPRLIGQTPMQNRLPP